MVTTSRAARTSPLTVGEAACPVAGRRPCGIARSVLAACVFARQVDREDEDVVEYLRLYRVGGVRAVGSGLMCRLSAASKSL